MSKIHFILQEKEAEVNGRKTIADYYVRDLGINIDRLCEGGSEIGT